MNKIIIIAVLFSFLSATLFAQNTNSNSRFQRFKLQSFEFGIGSQRIPHPHLLSNDFRTLYGPSLPNVQSDHAENYFFPSRNHYIGGMINIPSVAASFGIYRKDGTDFWGKPVLRASLSYRPTQEFFAFSSNERRYTIDSVYYNFQGNAFARPVDSVYSTNLSQSFRNDRLRLQTSILWHTKDFGKLSFYAGLGIGVGFSTHSKLNYTLSEYSQLRPDILISNSVLQHSEMGSKNGPMVFELMFSTTFGVSYRLSDKNTFWGRASIYGELSPSIFMTKSGQLPSQWNVGLTNNIGLRFRF